MARTPDLSWQTVDRGHLKDIYDSDQAMYPAPQLTYDRLKSWVDACPEICLCLQDGKLEMITDPAIPENGATHGLVIVLPLRQPYWDKLRHGDIEEHDIDTVEMFPGHPSTEISTREDSTRIKVGLHVFHIERFPSFDSASKKTGFTSLALDEIRGRVIKAFPSWDVVGFSGESGDNISRSVFSLHCVKGEPAGRGVTDFSILQL